MTPQVRIAIALAWLNARIETCLIRDRPVKRFVANAGSCGLIERRVVSIMSEVAISSLARSNSVNTASLRSPALSATKQ